MHIVVTVETDATRWTAYRPGSGGIVEAQGAIPAILGYREWLAALADALRPQVADAHDRVHAVMLVMPCDINMGTGAIIGLNGNTTAWTGRYPAQDLRALLDLPIEIYAMEGGWALLASENSQSAPAQLAICWGAGITAAVAKADQTIMPIAAAHFPTRTRHHRRCACGKTGCAGLLADGLALESAKFKALPELAPYEWTEALHNFIKHVVLPLAIAYPGTAIVVGGDVFNQAATAGMTPQTVIAQSLIDMLPNTVVLHIVNESEARDPLTDGGRLVLEERCNPTP